MEDLQTDTLSDYGKNKNQQTVDLDSNRDNENACAANLLNGCEEIDDSLDLMDRCENESIGSNSDVWKGSDSEDDNLEGKEHSETAKNPEKENNPDTTKQVTEETEQQDSATAETQCAEENKTDASELPDEKKCDDGSAPADAEQNTKEALTVESENQSEAENPEKVIENLAEQEKEAEGENESVGDKEQESVTVLNGDSVQEKNVESGDLLNDSVVENPLSSEAVETEAAEKATSSEDGIEKPPANDDIEKPPSKDDDIEKPPSKDDDIEKPPSKDDDIEKPPSKDDDIEKPPSKDDDIEKPPSNGDDTEQPSSSTDGAEKPSSSTDSTEKPSSSTDSTEKVIPSGDVVEQAANASTDKDAVICTEDKDPLADDALDKEMVEGRHPNRYNEGLEDESQMEYDAEDDDDFDPSLLCPEVSMAVDENAVVTNGPTQMDTGSDSPVPYEPLFSTFVDEVTGAEISFNLTPEEQELRKRLYGPTNAIQTSRIHCTACNVHLGSALEAQNNRFVHPLLKVLICKECYHFYTSGEFEKDEDGSELYCRWCGQGGQVLCCSKCEFVFCKRCIRTNFGRKKMFEIRDSDSWDCFRCNSAQIITQRIACYEFFEYVRREMSRPSMVNTSEIWSKDYSRCCQAKKRALENGGEQEVKKPKRKKGEKDPDYNPLVDKPVVVASSTPTLTPSTSSTSSTSGGVMFVSPNPVQLVSRFNANKKQDNDIEFVRQIPAPQGPMTSTARPTFRTILPSHIRPAFQSPTLLRISSQTMPPLVPTGARILGSALQGRPVNNTNMMKHEWFEKTVRAAARVNSHLSYTLTQLNKAQSQAASVEELAVVHNKLQEILSSSINSLIQIRKNLRTEFIAGIKTVRLPSKKTETFSNDDDVIFVSAPTTMPLPSTSQIRPPMKDPLIIIDNSNKINPLNNTPKAVGSNEWPKGYLKVKSVKDLQNVPSECITIPDDILPPKSNDVSKSGPSTEVVCNGTSNTVDTPIKADSENKSDPLVETPSLKSVETNVTVEAPAKAAEESKVSAAKQKTEGSAKIGNVIEPVKETRTRRSKADSRNNSMIYDVSKEPTVDIKRMINVKVNLTRVDLEELQKRLATKSQ